MSKLFIFAIISILFGVTVLAEDESSAEFHGSSDEIETDTDDDLLPEYLKNLTEKQQKEFYKIKTDDSLTFKQSNEQQIEFGKKYGFEAEIREDIDDLAKGYKYMLANRPRLIDEVSELHKKFAPIEGNDGLVKKDFNEKYAELRGQYPAAMDALEVLTDALLDESLVSTVKRRKR